MSDAFSPAIQVESPVLRVRKHGRVLTFPVLVMVVTAAATGFFVGALDEPWMNWLAAAAALALFLTLGVAPVLAWLTNRVVITNRRVIMRRGLFVHHRNEVSLARVREVRSRRGPLQQLFGSGDIELIVGTETPTVLRDVPQPTTIVDALQTLIEQDFARVAAASNVAGATTVFGAPATVQGTGHVTGQVTGQATAGFDRLINSSII